MGTPNPAICIGQDGEPGIYIQGGQCFGAGGDHIPLDKLPGWFWTQLSLTHRIVLGEVGFLEIFEEHQKKSEDEAARAAEAARVSAEEAKAAQEAAEEARIEEEVQKRLAEAQEGPKPKTTATTKK